MYILISNHALVQRVERWSITCSWRGLLETVVQTSPNSYRVNCDSWPSPKLMCCLIIKMLGAEVGSRENQFNLEALHACKWKILMDNIVQGHVDANRYCKGKWPIKVDLGFLILVWQSIWKCHRWEKGSSRHSMEPSLSLVSTQGLVDFSVRAIIHIYLRAYEIFISWKAGDLVTLSLIF